MKNSPMSWICSSMFTTTNARILSIISVLGDYADEKGKFENCRIKAQEENYTAGTGGYSWCFVSDNK